MSAHGAWDRGPEPTHTADPDARAREDLLVHAWRASQLERLGLTRAPAETFADLVDWHEIADLVSRGCPPELALEIVRG
jgi:hypothetical protein